MPRSGYSSGPTYYGKGRMPPNTSGTTRGPTPGPRYNPGGGDNNDPGGGGHHGGGHHGGGHHGGYYGYGHYYGYHYPYYYRNHYYRPYYYFGRGYGHYAYPYYSYGSRAVRVVNVELQGALDLNVKPKDTEVYLNGYFIGTVGDYDGWPRYLWLDEDAHELIFYKEGYETVVREVAIQPDAVIDLKFRMQPGPSTDPEELTRYKDRDRYESDRVESDRYDDRGSYRDRAYRDPERDRAYREGRRDEPSYRDQPSYGERGGPPLDESERPPLPTPPSEGVDLRAEAGRLVLKVTPPEASVYIDGRFVGIGGELSRLETGLLMDSGEHRIQVFHPEYETEARSFSVTEGKETQVGVTLESN